MKRKEKQLMFLVCMFFLGFILSGCGKKDNTEDVKKKQEESEIQETSKDDLKTKEVEEEKEEKGAEPEEKKKIEGPISENGNPYDFPVEKLGYYTNTYWGYDLKQIDGEYIVYDKYEFGYLVLENANLIIMDDNTFNMNRIDDADADVSFLDDGSFVLDKYQATSNDILANSYVLDALETNSASDDGYIDCLCEYGIQGAYVKSEMPTEQKITEQVKLNRSNVIETPQYENTQPIKNRREKEGYPKYLKYIPQEEYYICGDPGGNLYFWFMKAQTTPEDTSEELDFRNPYMYKMTLAKCDWMETENRWEIIDEHTFSVYGLDYEGMEHIGLFINGRMPLFKEYGYLAEADPLYFTLDNSKVEEGIITVHTNMMHMYEVLNFEVGNCETRDARSQS